MLVQSHAVGPVLTETWCSCRTCTSSAEWKAMMGAFGGGKKSMSTSSSASTAITSSSISSSNDSEPDDCPADVEQLGRSTWTLLHTMAAQYPSSAPPTTQSVMKQFISTFSQLYPCWVCADDFRAWMVKPENEPKVAGRDELGDWMCRAHNAVNVKLGKKEFDCSLWKERWRDGWKDGRCE